MLVRTTGADLFARPVGWVRPGFEVARIWLHHSPRSGCGLCAGVACTSPANPLLLGRSYLLLRAITYASSRTHFWLRLPYQTSHAYCQTVLRQALSCLPAGRWRTCNAQQCPASFPALLPLCPSNTRYLSISACAGPRPVRAALAVRAASGSDSTPRDNESKRGGVLPGLVSWPPKPFTSHGKHPLRVLYCPSP